MKTKKLLIMLLLAFTGVTTKAQESYIWAQNASGTREERPNCVSTDGSGNVYVVGYFYSTVLSVGSVNLINADTSGKTMDIFLVKYDAAGALLWAKNVGGIGNDFGLGVCTDAVGNVFITGYFEKIISFDSFSLTSAGNKDMFLVKYDASGLALWAKSAGGTQGEQGSGVSTDAIGNVIVTGWFSSTTLIFGTTSLANYGGPDIFLVKYDPSGNVLWAKESEGVGVDFGTAVATDARGNIFITGNFSSASIAFDSIKFYNPDYAYGNDIYLVKYDAGGKVIWGKSAVGSKHDLGFGVTTDASGNVFITGAFSSPKITFDSFSLNNSSNGFGYIYLVKYDASGNAIWAKSAGGQYEQYGRSVSTDTNGNVFLTGYFQSPILNFDSITLKNAGGDDIYIVKYDHYGNVVWAKSAGGPGSDYPFGLTMDVSGNLYITGWFSSENLVFGSISLTNVVQSKDMFLVKLGAVSNGIFEYLPDEQVSLFPNPSTNQINIKVHSSLCGSVFNIYNCIGDEVMSGKLRSENTSVDWNNLSAGMYLISVGENRRKVLKVLKE